MSKFNRHCHINTALRVNMDTSSYLNEWCILDSLAVCMRYSITFFVFPCAHKEGASYTYAMVSFYIYFFILNNTINILQMNIGFGRVTSSSFSLHFTIVDMTFDFLFTVSIEKTDVSWRIEHGLETMPRYTYNKRKNFTISCIQIGFNASKDIQEWMATVNLNLLTQNPIYLLSSYPYTGLTKLWKQTNKTRQTENLQRKTKPKQNNGSVTAGSGNLQKFSCPFYWEKFNFGCTASQWRTKPKIYKHIELSYKKWFKSHIKR